MIKSKFLQGLFYLSLLLVITLASCGNPYPHWTLEKTIDLDKSGPIGIVVENDHFWISDGNNNLLNKYDANWELVESIDEFDRPMHITIDDGRIYVPEYGSDEIITVANNQKDTLPVNVALNAPAGVDRWNGQTAIADFYSNTIIYGSGSDWKTFGEKGEGDGQFHYPTDIQIMNDTLYIADAYNHRIQVMTNTGQHVKTIGVAQEMNATTGIYVTPEVIFATDLENDRVLVFDHEGNVVDELIEGFDKPTDLILHNGKLYVLNYGAGEIVILSQPK